MRIRRTGKWILLESLNKEVRKLSCDATKKDLNMLECSVIIYDDIQSKVTKIDVFLVTIVIKFRERVRSRGREVHRDRQKTEHGKKCG